MQDQCAFMGEQSSTLPIRRLISSWAWRQTVIAVELACLPTEGEARSPGGYRLHGLPEKVPKEQVLSKPIEMNGRSERI